MSAFSVLKTALKEVRAWLLDTFRYRLKTRGKLFVTTHNVYIRPGCLSVGDYVFVGNNCHISCDTRLGNFVLIASSVSIVGGDHNFERPGVPTIFTGRAKIKPVELEDDVWIGQGSIILHGVRIGEGAIVGAGSVVTKDIPPYTIAVGAPAKVLRPRFTEEEVLRHKSALEQYRRDRVRLPSWKLVNEANPARS